MAELVFELGCEELPAAFTAKALSDLAFAVECRLTTAFDQSFQASQFATPRRLILIFPDIPDRQPTSQKEVRGPALKAAFCPDGSPLPPLIGFCKSSQVDPSSIIQKDGYAWAQKQTGGLPAMDVLKEILPAAVKALTFEKSMRWGSGSMKFARPIRWLAAVLDGQTVTFEVEGVTSGNKSRGHRFYSPDEFEFQSGEQLLAELRSRKVEPDAETRRKMIVDQAKSAVQGSPELPKDLVWENVYLTEWPSACAGRFRDAHLQLPAAVLTTAMAKHEKMFPVAGPSGSLTSEYVFIRNSGEDETVRRGTEWVLNARLDDAQFYFQEDQKHSLTDFLEKTSTIVFQAKLGTVKDRAERLHDLCAFAASWTSAEEQETDFAAKAGLYAKADLASGLVSELASLQGVIGGIYAAREGFDPAVCHAIASHYDPKSNFNPSTAGARTGLRLSLADAIDKLAGFLGVGLLPSGSSDPVGLRRAATAVIESCWSWPEAGKSVIPLFERASELYLHQGFAVNPEEGSNSLRELLISRYQSLLADKRNDLVEGAVFADSPEGPLNPRQVQFRLQCLELLSQDTAFVQAASRPINLLRASKKKGETWTAVNALQSVGDLDSRTGDALLQALADVEGPLKRSLEQENAADFTIGLLRLHKPIDAFFEGTMVMADDLALRAARLTLLQACADILSLAGDMSKIVISENGE